MKTFVQTDFSAFEIRLASQMQVTPRICENDYILLEVRGGVWRVVGVNDHAGLEYDEAMLTLEWIGGCADPGRLVKFSSGQARRLTDMEVIARAAQ